MPDISGATVFDDLPELIISGEIFPRLPSKDVLSCSAVSKSWHGAASTTEFLLNHHQRQPLLPLVSFRHKIISLDATVHAFDVHEARAKGRPILWFHDGHLGILASCDGLLLLSFPNNSFNIVNPATRQWLALHRLNGTYDNVVGMYPHPHHVGESEYRILFWKEKRADQDAVYYVLSVGSYQNQKPKCIGMSVASDCMKVAMSTGIESSRWRPPVLLNGCLHWDPYCCLKDRLLVFDTVEESFRSMRSPAASGSTRYLFEMEDTLGMKCLDNSKMIMKIWVLHDYEKEAWSLKCQIEMPMINFWNNKHVFHQRDIILVYYRDPHLHQLQYDDNGMLLKEFQSETEYPNFTEHLLKESLLRHTFFPSCRGGRGRVKQPRFFRQF